MKKYLVRFITTSDEDDKEWCYADSPEEAAESIEYEHWDIKEITMVTEL